MKKPKIYKWRGKWWCAYAYGAIGFGKSPQQAYFAMHVDFNLKMIKAGYYLSPGGGTVYAADLKSADESHVGSNPIPGTK